jgi:hypothetical protein
MSITPQAIRQLLDEVEASRASRKRAWGNLQEIRWILKDATGIDLPPAARKTIGGRRANAADFSGQDSEDIGPIFDRVGSFGTQTQR